MKLASIALTFTTSLLLSAGVAAEQEGDLSVLLDWITGDFDNIAQFEAQDGNAVDHLGLVRRVVTAPVLGEHVVYAQINQRADPADVYRQTIMVFEETADGSILARYLRFADKEAHLDILSDLARFGSLTADDFVPSLPAGCEPDWRFDGSVFTGLVARETCLITSSYDGTTRHIQSTELVGVDTIRNEESGYREDGSMIFGVPDNMLYSYNRVAQCDEPVFMVISGATLDGKRMGAYGAKLAETGIYEKVGGYYINAPRPVAVFQGDVAANHATLIVRFPCLANARRFWNSKTYQQIIKPLRENPPAGDYTVTVYSEVQLPGFLSGKVGGADYSAAFNPEALEQMP